MSSVALVAPTVRMFMVVADYDEELDEIETRVCPVVAIRSLVSPGGKCVESLIVFDPIDETINDAYEIATCDDSRSKVVACTWAPEQEAKELALIAGGLAFEFRAEIDKYRK